MRRRGAARRERMRRVRDRAAGLPGRAGIRAHVIAKRYGEREALKDVSFEAAAGERLAIIGPNGAGKTTLLQILAGALEPDVGELELPPAGWVPQRGALYPKLTVRENLKLFARLEKAPRGAVERMLGLTGLGGGE